MCVVCSRPSVPGPELHTAVNVCRKTPLQQCYKDGYVVIQVRVSVQCLLLSSPLQQCYKDGCVVIQGWVGGSVVGCFCCVMECSRIAFFCGWWGGNCFADSVV